MQDRKLRNSVGFLFNILIFKALHEKFTSCIVRYNRIFHIYDDFQVENDPCMMTISIFSSLSCTDNEIQCIPSFSRMTGNKMLL